MKVVAQQELRKLAEELRRLQSTVDGLTIQKKNGI
jgi:hypothetical protein